MRFSFYLWPLLKFKFNHNTSVTGAGSADDSMFVSVVMQIVATPNAILAIRKAPFTPNFGTARNTDTTIKFTGIPKMFIITER